MKILIVTAYFPPQNSIASLRPYSWAKYWSRWGHDVTVLTTLKLPHPSNSPMPYTGFRVLEVPVPGVSAIRSALRKLDGRESSLPVGGDLAPLQSSSLPSSNPLRRLTTTLRLRYGIFASCRMPDHHDLWALRSLLAVSAQKWDVIISTGGPYSTHLVGYILKRRGNTGRWGVDWRDLWTDNHIYPGLPLVRMVERYAEHKFHQHADVITTISEPLAAKLRLKAGNKVKVIYNGFDPEDYENLPVARIFPEDGVFRIVYTGTLYPGKRDPTPLLRAIKILDEQGKISPRQLQVVMAGANADVSDMAQREGVSAYVHYAGFVPRQDALRMQRDADALLFLEFEAPGVEGILTGKLFEYLFVQTPIIAVGISKDSAAGQIIENSGRGRAYGKDIQKLADELLQMLKTGARSQREQPGELHLDIRQFSRAAQAERLLALVSSA